ncbi:MAG: VCBS repeat-containing protein [Planctomycetota bacterium]
MPCFHPFAAAAAVLALPLAAQNLPTFHAPVEFPDLVGEYELLGDLDLDGDVDAISFHSPTQNAIKTTFTVWLNSGTGTLTPAAPSPLPGGAGTRTRLADLDGDGRLDLIVATISTSPLGSGLLVFAGQPGGSFGPYQHTALPGNVLAVQSGNGNGDAVADLVLTHGSGSSIPTRWLFGGAGFALVLGPTAVLPTALDLAVVDANGDGIDDVAVPLDNGAGPDALTFWSTTPTGFQAGPTLGLPASIAQYLTTFDGDGDGDRDVLAYGIASPNGLFFTTCTNLGGGAWSGTTQTIANGSLGRLFAGDWNGDGRDDLAMRSSNSGTVGQEYHTLALYENVGSGTFTARYSLMMGGAILDFGAGFRDLNQDGNLDFLDTDSVYFGDGTFRYPFGTGSTSPLIDWDGDGDQDVLPHDLVLHDGNGVLSPMTFGLPPLPPNHFYDGTRFFTDLDGDGRHELLVGVLELVLFQYQFRATHLLRETTDHQFVFVGLATAAPTRLTSGVVDDTDGDGDQDIVNRQGLWLNDGTNSFTLQGPFATGYEPIAKGDVDGDGDQDLLATTTGAGTSLAVLHRTAPNTWSTTVLFPANGVTIIAVAPTRFFDVDDDGDLDVVARDRQSNGVWRALVFTNQNGVFTQSATLPFAGTALVGDVDGDGLTDLAFSDVSRLRLLRRTGPGLVYAPPVTFLTPASNLLVDFDQDGDLDATGADLVQNNRFAGAAAGHRRQYGIGSVGAGGWRPILSMRGPCRPGLSPSVSLRHGPPGTFALLILGSGPHDAPSIFLPGVQSYVLPIDVLLGFTLDANGGIDLPLTLPAAMAGASAFLEFVLLDVSVPFAFTNTNGCELAIGQ